WNLKSRIRHPEPDLLTFEIPPMQDPHGPDPHGADPHGPHSQGLPHHDQPHPPGDAIAQPDHGSHGVAKYLYVFAALTLLTTASFMTYTDLWRNNIHSEAAGWTFM